MPRLHRFLYSHAQELLMEYHQKNEKQKQMDRDKEENDQTLLKDSMYVYQIYCTRLLYGLCMVYTYVSNSNNIGII